jgi:hypothetical protein
MATFQTTIVNFHGKKVTEETFGSQASFGETMRMLEASLAEGGIKEIIYDGCGEVVTTLIPYKRKDRAHV